MDLEYIYLDNENTHGVGKQSLNLAINSQGLFVKQRQKTRERLEKEGDQL